MAVTDTGTYWIIVMVTGMTLLLIIAVIGSVVINQRSRIRHHQEKIDLILKGERRYHDLFHGVSDIVYVHSLAGEILEINQRGADLLRMTMEELRSRNIGEFLPEQYRAAYEAYLRQVGESASEAKGYLPFRSRGGGKFAILEYTSSPYHRGNGEEPTVRGIARDVTEHIRLARSLQRMERKTKALLTTSELAQKKLSILSHSILQMQEEDRRRIGRELHDEVSQLLVAIGVNLDVVRGMLSSPNGQIKERLDDTKQITENILDRVRRVLKEFRSLDIEKKGLIPSLRAYVDEYASRTGIEVQLIEDDLAEILRYDQKIVIYRVVQESLTNAAKYARAKKIAITMRCQSDDISLEVRDDGAGFDVERQNQDPADNHLGILGMHERVKIVNGKFTIESGPGRGTRVRVTLPIHDGPVNHSLEMHDPAETY